MQHFIPCHFLDVANTMLEITDFCPKLRILSILITDFSFQRLAALQLGSYFETASYLFLTVVHWQGHVPCLIPKIQIKPARGERAFTLAKDQ